MSEQAVAGVSVSEVLRDRFRKQLARYRELVASSADTGGSLTEAEVAELVELVEALKLPPDRFERDRWDLIGIRSVEERLHALQVKNATTVADVPQLEAEIAQLSAEFSRIRGEADSACRLLEEQMMAKRREIRKETTRYRESTGHLEQDLIERREANPVLFRRDAEPSDWANMLLPRKPTIRG